MHKWSASNSAPLFLSYLFFAVLQHILELGELLVLLCFDPLGLISQPVGVVLLQTLYGLFLLFLKVLHLLVILTFLSLCGESEKEEY